jgi:ribosomal protein S18 acetylase RimI-like enzyme
VDFRTVADNLRESFRVIAASRGPGEIRELGGVSIASAGVAFQMFNAAFLSAPVLSEAELARRIMLSAVHFQARGLGWACWVCDDWLGSEVRQRGRRIFEQHGLRHSVDLPGMAAERLAPPARPLPRIEARRVGDRVTREAFCNISTVCFHVPAPWFREVFDNDSVWENFAAYVGYVDGEPVSSAATVARGAAVGVYNVATLPEAQNRGYGEAVMRYALEDTRKRSGIQGSVLQSTPAGYRLYERMGYRRITTVSVYSS